MTSERRREEAYLQWCGLEKQSEDAVLIPRIAGPFILSEFGC